MTKYHVKDNGEPGRCEAAEGNCPLGGEHFSSEEEARVYYETQNSGDALSTLKKPAQSTPADITKYDVIIPQQQFRSEEKKIEASEIKLEYVIKDDSGAVLGTVMEKSNGYKNTNVVYMTEDGKVKKASFPLMKEIDVVAPVETEESVKARSAAYLEDAYRHEIARYKPQRVEILRDLATRAENGEALSGYSISRLVEADARDTVYERYKQVYEAMGKRYREDPSSFPSGHFATEANKVYTEQLKENIIQAADGVNNLSTRAASNLQDREILSAQAEFVRRFVY